MILQLQIDLPWIYIQTIVTQPSQVRNLEGYQSDFPYIAAISIQNPNKTEAIQQRRQRKIYHLEDLDQSSTVNAIISSKAQDFSMRCI